MRIPTGSVRQIPRVPELSLDAIREISLDVARAALAVFQERRWVPTPQAVDAYTKAIAVITADHDLGAVCDADYAAMRIREMAQDAHAITLAARHDACEGSALLSRVMDRDLVDPLLDDVLAPAYAVVAIPIA